MNGYAQREASVDCGSLYESIRTDFVGLVGRADPGAADRFVPATPAWRVRDVLAHVTGITEDLNAGYFGDGDPDAFTRAQVERHRPDPIAEIITVWDHEAPRFEDGLRVLGYQVGNHFVGDLFIHFVDVAATLDHPVDRDSTAVWVALDWYLDALEESHLAQRGTLEVVTGAERRLIGRGEVTARVVAPAFEILRACAGRRSDSQIASLAWSGDAGGFIRRLSQYAVPVDDVID